jgi:hypothetical protein
VKYLYLYIYIYIYIHTYIHILKYNNATAQHCLDNLFRWAGPPQVVMLYCLHACHMRPKFVNFLGYPTETPSSLFGPCPWQYGMPVPLGQGETQDKLMQGRTLSPAKITSTYDHCTVCIVYRFYLCLHRPATGQYLHLNAYRHHPHYYRHFAATGQYYCSEFI